MTYVFAAYTVVWILLFGYSLTLSGRQKRLETELALLEKVVGSKGQG